MFTSPIASTKTATTGCASKLSPDKAAPTTATNCACFREKFLKKGAVRVMTEFARKTVGVSRLLLEIEDNNAASVAVARAAGYRLTDAPPVPSEEKGRSLVLRTWEYEEADPRG